jgi:hypothetical protein
MSFLTGRRAQAEAKRFAETVVPGRTYYSIVNARFAWGPERLLQEWTFTKPGLFSAGQPMCGHLSAAGLWLSYGPIHATRPPRLLTLSEYRRSEVGGPDPRRAVAEPRKLEPTGR